ncbi:hypothetical protein PPERSA_01632 [Pseudocohnilembus persalinus]|uniref:Uncharacterized protein n=1 Tax=Pseudocohnilembus persalinus TaxID=266149 RepID=A0A0V0R5F2_PSEPJ|nr:hypothetical protein PPERSA_01632 [Pseudocohnilembus persalinus]|eukprot:KRX09432.1 hypothetical protein PPERSA_01632 [Pseudocohnilembus persalinus]
MASKLQNYQEPNRKNNQNPIISDIIESYENHVQIEKEKKRKLYQLILNYKQNPLEQEQLEKSKQKTTQEIEKKFQKSQANKQFVFPRNIDENDVLDSDFSDISSDFKDVTLYDLFSQNKKNEIILQKSVKYLEFIVPQTKPGKKLQHLQCLQS